MTVQSRLRPAILASALGLIPLLGCFGPSNDKGDQSPGPYVPAVDASKTGGLGENRDGQVPRPGGSGPKASDGVPSGPK